MPWRSLPLLKLIYFSRIFVSISISVKSSSVGQQKFGSLVLSPTAYIFSNLGMNLFVVAGLLVADGLTYVGGEGALRGSEIFVPELKN